MTIAPWVFKPFTLPEALAAADAVAKRDVARDICDPYGAWHTWCLVYLPEQDRAGVYKQFIAAYLAAHMETPTPSDSEVPERQESSMRRTDIERLAEAVRGQVSKFSDPRLNDYDCVWREREVEYRCCVAETANAVCVALQLDAPTFAAACGLYVSDGRDAYSDCRPGELTWEKPRGDAS